MPELLSNAAANCPTPLASRRRYAKLSEFKSGFKRAVGVKAQGNPPHVMRQHHRSRWISFLRLRGALRRNGEYQSHEDTPVTMSNLACEDRSVKSSGAVCSFPLSWNFTLYDHGEDSLQLPYAHDTQTTLFYLPASESHNAPKTSQEQETEECASKQRKVREEPALLREPQTPCFSPSKRTLQKPSAEIEVPERKVQNSLVQLSDSPCTAKNVQPQDHCNTVRSDVVTTPAVTSSKPKKSKKELKSRVKSLLSNTGRRSKHLSRLIWVGCQKSTRAAGSGLKAFGGTLRRLSNHASTEFKEKRRKVQDKTKHMMPSVPIPRPHLGSNKPRNGLATYSSSGLRSHTTGTSKVWKKVSDHQLRALYAITRTSLSKDTSDKLFWMEATADILCNHATCRDIDDPVREAALDGNGVITCITILKEVSQARQSNSNKTEAFDPPHAERQKSEVNSLDLTRATLRVLQELCLNIRGAQTFNSHDGAAIVMERIGQLNLIPRDSELDDDVLPLHNPTFTELDCLNITYRLVFATCISDADASEQWMSCNIARFPLVTLSRTDKGCFQYKHPIYSGLALGVLRLLCGLQNISRSEAIEYARTAFHQLQCHDHDAWVTENALAILSSTQRQFREVTETLEGMNFTETTPWKIVIERCRTFRNEGQVLCEGLETLKYACSAKKDLAGEFIDYGAEEFVDAIVPKDRDVYIEQLLSTGIGLKQLLLPFDFEANEVQHYLRSASYKYQCQHDDSADVGHKLSSCQRREQESTAPPFNQDSTDLPQGEPSYYKTHSINRSPSPLDASQKSPAKKCAIEELKCEEHPNNGKQLPSKKENCLVSEQKTAEKTPQLQCNDGERHPDMQQCTTPQVEQLDPAHPQPHIPSPEEQQESPRAQPPHTMSSDEKLRSSSAQPEKLPENEQSERPNAAPHIPHENEQLENLNCTLTSAEQSDCQTNAESVPKKCPLLQIINVPSIDTSADNTDTTANDRAEGKMRILGNDCGQDDIAGKTPNGFHISGDVLPDEEFSQDGRAVCIDNKESKAHLASNNSDTDDRALL